MRKGSNRRPIGGKWWQVSILPPLLIIFIIAPFLCLTDALISIQMDFFNICAITGFVMVTAVLSDATSTDIPKLRQASMSPTIILYLAGGLLLILGIMNALGWKTPIRFSSVPRGQVPKPGVFVLIEDIVAVEGAGGQEYRKELVARYEGSKVFQEMLRQVNWFWSVGTLVVAVVMTVLVFEIDNLDVVFALGWSLPWAWGAFGAVITMFWVKNDAED